MSGCHGLPTSLKQYPYAESNGIPDLVVQIRMATGTDGTWESPRYSVSPRTADGTPGNCSAQREMEELHHVQGHRGPGVPWRPVKTTIRFRIPRHRLDTASSSPAGSSFSEVPVMIVAICEGLKSRIELHGLSAARWRLMLHGGRPAKTKKEGRSQRFDIGDRADLPSPLTDQDHARWHAR